MADQLLSYHNDPKIKAKYLKRVRAHYKADAIVQGVYWQSGKGCAVGCTVHSGSHRAYEEELGLPYWLARLEDALFEGMSNEDAKQFPVDFLKAIPIGVSLDLVKAQWFHWLLVDPTHGVLRHVTTAPQQRAITGVANLYDLLLHGHTVSIEQWEKARRKAINPCTYATDAAYYAASSENYDSADVVDCAAEATQGCNRDVMTKQRYYKVMADKLLELLKSAKVVK